MNNSITLLSKYDELSFWLYYDGAYISLHTLQLECFEYAYYHDQSILTIRGFVKVIYYFTPP